LCLSSTFLSLFWLTIAVDGQEQQKTEKETGEVAKPLACKPQLIIRISESANWLAFSPNGKVLAVASCGQAGKIRFFDTPTGKILKQTLSHPWDSTMPLRIVFSPDGTLIASVRSAFWGEMRLWQWEAEAEIAGFKNLANPTAAHFDPTGKQLVLAEIQNVVFFRCWKERGCQEGAFRDKPGFRVGFFCRRKEACSHHNWQSFAHLELRRRKGRKHDSFAEWFHWAFLDQRRNVHPFSGDKSGCEHLGHGNRKKLQPFPVEGQPGASGRILSFVHGGCGGL
jgi:hypothetical protein